MGGLQRVLSDKVLFLVNFLLNCLLFFFLPSSTPFSLPSLSPSPLPSLASRSQIRWIVQGASHVHDPSFGGPQLSAGLAGSCRGLRDD